jgi:hypothetical protein
VPGAVGFIQTAGELLNFHPHVHLLVSDGVFDRDGVIDSFSWAPGATELVISRGRFTSDIVLLRNFR